MRDVRAPRESRVRRIAFEAISLICLGAGLLALARVLHAVGSGTLPALLSSHGDVHAEVHPAGGTIPYVRALLRAFALPVHLLAVGVFLRRRSFSPRGRRVAWIAVVLSGCWLGVALLVRILSPPH
ncbi:MAG: hypothetical protein GF330_10670 [Candidatus Eisenbacteria bacterium]|nr:hypothetical protein [Candidatus Eisenbacteria bacterium]